MFDENIQNVPPSYNNLLNNSIHNKIGLDY